ncbi:hypothetical protein ApDm4_2362 [Acetobacter pomorum]|nr:hypothetical protein ApDm4_2362 [Acetobacter pomorum]
MKERNPIKGLHEAFIGFLYFKTEFRPDCYSYKKETNHVSLQHFTDCH